jgi:GT2 family glycosyltransferase
MFAATLLVPTRNRRDCLRLCLEAALVQTVPLEIVVLDDGSDDGTDEMVRRDYPGVRYERFAGPSGPSRLRNVGSRMASTPVLFPIDDDAVMVSRHTVEQTLAEFSHPRVAAVAIPFVNVRKDKAIHQLAPEPRGVWVCDAYVGASHALRRDVFLAVGGYREELFYMGEEGDLCVRLLARGYVVRLGRADAIHHLESPNRSSRRADLFGRRNDVLYAWHNVPMPYLPAHLVATTLKGMRFGFRCGKPMRMFEGLARGYGHILRHPGSRRPVSRSIYGTARLLRLRGGILLKEIEPRLPPLDRDLRSAGLGGGGGRAAPEGADTLSSGVESS